METIITRISKNIKVETERIKFKYSKHWKIEIILKNYREEIYATIEAKGDKIKICKYNNNKNIKKYKSLDRRVNVRVW